MSKAKVKPKKSRSAHVKTRIVAFKVTPDQYAMIEERAKDRGMPIGAWLRPIVIQAAKSPRTGQFMRITEPNGATT